MDISILICTYKPDLPCFFRVMDAVLALHVPAGLKVECIVVDNNSPDPVEKVLLSRYNPDTFAIPFRVVSEPKPGLLHARKRGFESSEGSVIVFFDDDNEPDPEYLTETWKTYKIFPNIGVAGPGTIRVEFLGDVAPWVPFYKGYFQERKLDQLQYACYPHWLGFYPPGTGQTVRRHLYAHYLEKVEAGIYSSVGRTKKSMASAEDVQLVFNSILQEYAVASVPTMKLNHLIASRKTTVQYLKRLLFGMASSYPEAYAECFPHTRRVLPFYTNGRIFSVFWEAFYLKIVQKKSPRAFLFHIAELLGKIYGSNQARGENRESFWFSLISLLKLK